MNVFQIDVFIHILRTKTAYDNGDEETLIMEDDIHIDFIDKWKI